MKRKEARLHLRIDATVKAEAEKIAREENRTLTSLVEQLLKQYVAEQLAAKDVPQA